MMFITFILLVFYSVLDIQYEEISTWKLQAGILLVFSIGAVSSANISRYVIVLCSGVYMLLSKSDRNKRLPLIPVMTAAYVITIFIIRGGVYW